MKTNITNIDIDPQDLRNRMRKLIEVDQKVNTNWNLNDVIHEDKNYTRKILAYGPGTGKTQKLRQFAANPKNFNKSILIACKTIEECNNLAKDILAEYITHYTSTKNPDDLLTIVPDDFIYVMTSSNDITGLTQMLSSPAPFGRDLKEYIGKFPILITTHSSFINEPVSLLSGAHTDYKFNTSDARREYIIVDEFPILGRELRITIEDHFALLGIISELGQGKTILPRQRMKMYCDAISGKYPDNIIACNKVQQMVNKAAGVENSNALRNYRGITEIHLADDYYTEALRLNEVKFPPPIHCLNNFENNHVIILDGTGDLVAKDSKYWTVDNREDFQRVIECDKLEILPFDLERKTVDEDPFTIQQEMAHTLSLVRKVISENDKLLIVSWMKTENKKTIIDDTGHKITKIIESPTLMDYIESHLTVEEKSKIMTTHYQSGKTRATNEFIECDSILFLGRFYLKYETVKIDNTYIDAEATIESRAIAELVQATYRTRARLVQHDPIKIYLTSDWNESTIYAYVERMKLKPKQTNLYKNVAKYIGKIPGTIRSDIADDIIKIMNSNDTIVNGDTVTIPFRKLVKLIPKAKEERNRYNAHIKALKSMNYTLLLP